MKKLAVALLGIVVLLIISVLAGPKLIDLRSRVAAAVHDATGRDLRIDGAFRVSLFPELRVTASDVHLSNAPGAAAPDMLSIRTLSLAVKLWPLLQRRLVVDSFTIDRPTVNLEVDKNGRPNWAFKPPGGVRAAGNAKPETQKSGRLLRGIQLGDVKVEQGHLSYRNDVTGQTIDAEDVTLAAAMNALETPLAVHGRMIVNDKPVKGALAVDTLGQLRRGRPAKVTLSFETPDATAEFDGTAQERPVPGLNGVFDLDIPSVGRLAAWLNLPFSKGHPDPGPLKVHAVFASDGAKSALKEATITGTALNVKASGSVDLSGGATKLTAAVESGVLDIDRYLPRRALGKSAPQKPAAPADLASFHPGDPFAVLSDRAFNLEPLRKLDADIKVSVAGVKAMGYDIGRIACTATAKGGVVDIDLGEIALYGGKVTGAVKLDGAGTSLALDAAAKMDHVAAESLVRLVAAGGPEFSGAVSAALDVKARGTTPRALAEDMRGRLAVDLGGVSMKKAGSRAATRMKLDLDVPGGDKRPSLTASAIYNGEPIEANASLAPLRTMASGERFPASLAVNSKLVTLRYAGAVQQKPVLGLEGTFDFEAPSVAKLAAWAGEPLDPGRPDPGPLKLHAVLASDGAKLAIKNATIDGKAIRATAQGTFDAGRKPATFDASIDVKQADLNAYLPPQAKKPAAVEQAPPKQRAAGWTTAPFNLAPLGYANGKAAISLASVRYRNLDITKGDIDLGLSKRVLKLMAKKLALAQGSIESALTLDGSGGGAKLDYRADIVGVQARPLLEAFAGSDRLSGTIAFETTIKGTGRNEKELISSLDGTGHFKITDGAIYGINLAQALREVGTLGFGSSKAEKTDFAELSGSYAIKSGVIDNRDMKMLAPLVRLTGSGSVPLPSRTVDYAVEAKLVPTIQGQGGTDSLAGLPIPIKVTGPWSSLSYKIDWTSVFREMAADPERLKRLPSDLSKAAKDLGISLPIPGGTGPGSPGGILKQIPGLPQAPPVPPSAPGNTQRPSPALPFGLLGLLGK